MHQDDHRTRFIAVHHAEKGTDLHAVYRGERYLLDSEDLLLTRPRFGNIRPQNLGTIAVFVAATPQRNRQRKDE